MKASQQYKPTMGLNLLRQHGYSLADVLGQDLNSDLLRIPNMGPKTIRDLKEYALELGCKPPPVVIELVVTRHPGLLAYLLECGLATTETQVVAHASPDAVTGLNVCGVLPHSLSCLTASFTEVPLNLPAELRGQELTLEQVRQYAGEPVTYNVRKI